MKATILAPRAESNLGAFRYGGLSGIIPAALTANSEIFQFRWAPVDTTKLCLIRRVTIAASVTTTMFAAGVPVQLDMIKSRGWTAAGTGGTAPTIGADLKRRTSLFSSSSMVAGDLRIATTAALGAGTKTLESSSLATLLAAGPITASLNGSFIPPNTLLWNSDVAAGDYPLVLESQEGFSIRSVAVPATGTWQVAISVDWTEAASY
jgi:hypothetical protein